MQAKDVMTTKVVTVDPDTEIERIAQLLLDHRISGVPVVDAHDHLLGIVSEGDLMRRPELETERRRSWWLALLSSRREDAAEYIKTHGKRARDVMTRNVVTVDDAASVGRIAELMEKQRIKRVPVVDDGKLVGIVSRANLLHGLIARQHEIKTPPSGDDRSLRDAVKAALEQEGWVTHGHLNVIVDDGVVELWGWIESDQEREAMMLAARNVPGVKDVEDHLGAVKPWVWGV